MAGFAEGGSGGGGLILTEITTITPAQIRDWHNTPIDIVPALGAGRVGILVGSTMAELDFTTPAHIDGGDLEVRYTGAPDRLFILEGNGLVNAVADATRQAAVGRNPGQPQSIVTSPDTAIEMHNSGAAITGTGNSPIIVTAHYIDVASQL